MVEVAPIPLGVVLLLGLVVVVWPAVLPVVVALAGPAAVPAGPAAVPMEPAAVLF